MSELSFGEAIRVVRKRQGLTQAELSDRARVTRQTIVKIERVAGKVSRGTHDRVVRALGFTLGVELLAAAGDARSIAHVGYAAEERARAKRLAAVRNREISSAPTPIVAPRPRLRGPEPALPVELKRLKVI